MEAAAGCLGKSLPRQVKIVVEREIATLGIRIVLQLDVDRALNQAHAGTGLGRRNVDSPDPVGQRSAQPQQQRHQGPKRGAAFTSSRSENRLLPQNHWAALGRCVRLQIGSQRDHASQTGGHEHHEEAHAVGPGQVADLDHFDPAVLRVAEAGHGEAGQKVARANSRPVQIVGAAKTTGTRRPCTATRLKPTNTGR